MENFDAYCTSKKINSELFKAGEEALYMRFAQEFASMHPNSFTEQKKFYINNLRRKYLLTEPVEASASAGEKRVAAPPVMKPAAPRRN